MKFRFLSQCASPQKKKEKKRREKIAEHLHLLRLSVCPLGVGSALNEWNIEPDDARHFSFSFLAAKKKENEREIFYNRNENFMIFCRRSNSAMH